MLVVSPNLVVRVVNGALSLHTMESERTLSFPNPGIMGLLFRFARPADEGGVMAMVPDAERQQVETALAALKDIGALRAVEADDDPGDDAEPSALVPSHLGPLTEALYRLAGDIAALSPEAAAGLQAETGQGLQRRLESLIAGASALELELRRLRPDYVAGQLRRLGVDQDARSLKLHIGAGLDPLPGWVNIDAYPAELALDVTRGLPFADGAADYVFMSHILEHLFYPDAALALLGETRRVLAPGGRVRIIVPDVEKCLRAYVEKDDEFFAARKDTWTWWEEANTRLEDFLAYAGAGPRPSHFMDSHKFGYDFETLAHLLAEAGFRDAERSEYMAARDPVLRIDDVSRVAGAKFGAESYSLFVDATVV